MSYNNHNSICFSPTTFSSSPSSPGIFNESKKVATKKWNLILSVFYQQMPLKCHWKYLWPYENSFTGKEAVDFLLLTLPKIIFGQTIQRVNCSRLLQKFLSHGLIINVRNPKDLEFTEKNSTIFRFDDAKIEYEICKTNASTFNDSLSSLLPNPVIRRVQSNNEQYFSHSDTRFPMPNNRSATVFSSPPSASTSCSKPRKSTIFSSFRNLKRSKKQPQQAEPIFHIPPPPSTPPPPLSSLYPRKRDSAQFSPPINKNIKHPRLSLI